MPVTRAKAKSAPRSRRGTALIIVLVAITMLTLGAYQFSNTMLTEYRASEASAKAVQSQLWAQSGVQYVAALLTPDGGGWTSDLYNNSALFQVPMTTNMDGGFSIVAPLEDLSTEAQMRMGLIDECGKLNVNFLANMTDLAAARNTLLMLPNMTEALADGILDWIDADFEPRDYGAEFDSYTSVTPRDGPIDTLEELLLVGGMNPWLLYGEDVNRNGVMDLNENDGAATQPWDDSDGLLTLGWVDFLTVRSLESNLQRSPELIENYGQPKININMASMADLYDQLEALLGTDAATYVVAYRMWGPVAVEGETVVEPTVTESPLNGAQQAAGTGDAATDEAVAGAAGALANAITGGMGTTTRNGMDLSQAPTTNVKSLFELVGSSVTAMVEGAETAMSSPWGGSPGDLQQVLPILMDSLTTTDQTIITGRINVLQARIEVLRAIPNIPPELPDMIVAARGARLASGAATPDQITSAGWLVVDGLVDLPTMRMLDPWLTGRGDVYRFQVVGHSDLGGPMIRYDAVVDASGATPKIIFQRELQDKELGQGYRLDQMPRFSPL